MPWKECHVVDERLRFIARLLDGEKMAGLCREFGISRKTGYKIYSRYKDCGLGALTDRSHFLLQGDDFTVGGLHPAELVVRHAVQLPQNMAKSKNLTAGIRIKRANESRRLRRTEPR